MYPKIRKILTVEDQQKAIEAARADNDNMVFPTHIVEKKGEVVGAWSMAGVPLVMTWQKSDSVTARESLILKNTIDSIMDDRGTSSYFIACNSNSNYYDHMQKFGFEPVWPTNIFIKE
jgi:hypothetical protein